MSPDNALHSDGRRVARPAGARGRWAALAAMATKRHRRRVILGSALLFAAHSGFAAERSFESLELSLLHESAVVAMEPEPAAQLARKTAAYFETCHTRQSVVGDAPDEGIVLRQWEEATQGTHALLRMSRPGGSAELLVGFASGSGAWPVILHQDDSYIPYLKCDGLEGAVLACDVSEILPRDDEPRDCDRLREIERQESSEDESTMPEGAR